MRRVLIGLLVVLAATHVGCRQSSTKEQAEKERAERQERAKSLQEQRREVVAELAAAYQAVVTSSKSFTWTADVQDALMPDDGRPVAGIASLADVERDGKSYVVRLVYGDPLRPPIVLMLKCDRLKEKPESSVMETGDRTSSMMGPQYAFVAKIEAVKVHRGVVPDQAGPDVQRAGWVAEGKCLALRKMPVEEGRTSRPVGGYTAPRERK
jgi:hypothetical protein